MPLLRVTTRRAARLGQPCPAAFGPGCRVLFTACGLAADARVLLEVEDSAQVSRVIRPDVFARVLLALVM
jgi:hypothetical protein